MIQFMDQDQYDAVSYLKSHRKGSGYDLEQRCYYPVYPSFVKTIGLMKKYGVTPGTEVTADQVDKLVITDSSWRYQRQTDGTYATGMEDDYDYYEVELPEERVYTFTEQDQIEAIMTALIPEDYADMNAFNPTDYYSNVTVTVGSGPKRKEYNYRLDVDRVPEFLKQAMDFDAARKIVKYER